MRRVCCSERDKERCGGDLGLRFSPSWWQMGGVVGMAQSLGKACNLDHHAFSCVQAGYNRHGGPFGELLKDPPWIAARTMTGHQPLHLSLFPHHRPLPGVCASRVA